MKCPRCKFLMKPDSHGHTCTGCSHMVFDPQEEPKLPIIKTPNKKKPCKNDVNRIMESLFKKQNGTPEYNIFIDEGNGTFVPLARYRESGMVMPFPVRTEDMCGGMWRYYNTTDVKAWAEQRGWMVQIIEREVKSV